MFTWFHKQSTKQTNIQSNRQPINNQVLKLKGGGGVRQTLGKKKVTAVTTSDEALFKKAYDIALKAHNLETVQFKEMVKTFTTEDAEQMLHYLKHDKTTTTKKIEHLGCMTGELKTLSDAIEKLSSMKEKLNKMVAEAVVEECSDADGNFKITNVQQLLQIEIGIKKGRADSDRMD